MPSRVTAAGYHAGRRAPNAGKRYPAEILTAEEVRASRAVYRDSGR